METRLHFPISMQRVNRVFACAHKYVSPSLSHSSTTPPSSPSLVLVIRCCGNWVSLVGIANGLEGGRSYRCSPCLSLGFAPIPNRYSSYFSST